MVGVSPDTPLLQDQFKQKYSLPFPLLCDVDRKVAKEYGVLKEKNMYGDKLPARGRQKGFARSHRQGDRRELLGG